MKKKAGAWVFGIDLPTIVLFLVAGSAWAAWPVWKGGDYNNNTYTDPFNQMYWSVPFAGDTDHYIFTGDGADSLAGKWVNLVLSDDVSVYRLRATGGDHTANYTVNLDMNGKHLTSVSSASKNSYCDGGVGADPGVVFNVTNSSATASVFTWNALRIAYDTNTMGTVNVSGPNVTLTVQENNPRLGFAGKGTLNVTGGAVFDAVNSIVLGGSESSMGVVNVSGIGSVVTSTTVYVGAYGGGGGITVKDGAFWYSAGELGLGQSDSPGHGTAVVSGTNSVFSVLKCQIREGMLTLADGGHLEVRAFSDKNNYHIVGPNGTLRFDNGTLRSAGRWTFQGGSTVEFVLKDARTTPFLEVIDQWVIIARTDDAQVVFEMDPDPELAVNDFIPLTHGSSCDWTFEGYPEDHEFSVPYGQYAYTFRINYNIGPSGDRTMGLTVLSIPPRGTVLMIR